MVATDMPDTYETDTATGSATGADELGAQLSMIEGFPSLGPVREAPGSSSSPKTAGMSAKQLPPPLRAHLGPGTSAHLGQRAGMGFDDLLLNPRLGEDHLSDRPAFGGVAEQ